MKNIILLVCYVASIADVFAQTNSQPISLQAATTLTLPLGASPSDVAIVDLDGDLRPDLAVAERGLNDVRVFRQVSFGGFAPGVAYPAGLAPTGVFALGMDTPLSVLNDLAVVSGRMVNTYLNANDGQATLLPQAPVYYGVSNRPPVQPAIAAGYMDRDAYVDFVYTVDDSFEKAIGCLRHTGGNTFANGGYFLQSQASSTCVTLADLNGDAYLDVLVNRPATDQIRLYAHNGFGAWVNTNPSGMQDLATGGTQPVSIAAADVSGDQRPDIAVANAGNNTVGLLLSGAPWQYATPVTFAQSAAPRQVLLLDLNGDFRADMVTLTADARLNLWLNTALPGPDRFRLAASLPTGPDPVVLKAADVLGDSAPDLIVACAGDNTVRLYRNNSRVLGSASAAQLAGVDVFPNPAADQLMVRLPHHAQLHTEVSLIDATGRKVLRRMVTGAHTLDVGGLARGLYVLHLRNEAGEYRQRVVLH